MDYSLPPEGQVRVVLSSAGSLLGGLPATLPEICSGWLRRLGLAGKNLVIYERSLESDPGHYARDRHLRVGGRWLHCLGSKGEIIEPMSIEAFTKAYTTIVLEMLPNNWGHASLEMFERIIVHELLHVSNPTRGLVFGLGLSEDYSEMWRLTNMMIVNFGSLVGRYHV